MLVTIGWVLVGWGLASLVLAFLLWLAVLWFYRDDDWPEADEAHDYGLAA